MRLARLLGVLLLISAAALIAASVVTGEGHVSLVLVIPVFWATGPLGFLGVTVLMLAFVVLLFGPLLRGVPPAPASGPAQAAEPPTPTATTSVSPRYGGVVVVGPFPFAFGSDRQLATWMFVVGLAIAAGFVILTVLFLVNAALSP